MAADREAWLRKEMEGIADRAEEVRRSLGKGKIDAEKIAMQAYAGMVRLFDVMRALLDRVEHVEERGVRYRGVYQRSEDYKRGDLVTFEGSMWHATRDTIEEPGASKDWQLAVKKGRDA